MKKFYVTIALLLLFSTGFSQTPRLILVEEFTGETCGPCAVNNPGFNAILNSYPSIVISLKYQNNIPSPGPNFYAYNTADVANRTAYYANNYSPHAFIDGNYWNGNAGSMTASQLTNRSNVQSPFEVFVEQSFSPLHDIIYVHTVIRATAAVSGNLKARIAISERDIYGYTSPNGESDYQHVMRKLLPTGTGTALPATWAIGDSVVIDEQWTITVPTNPNVDMPAWARLESIVWVQDDNTKEIMQTGHTTGPAVPYDPSLTVVNGLAFMTCTGNVTPTLVATNYEPGAVTSMDIEYYADNQTPSVYNWTGNLAQNATVNIALPSIPVTGGGTHTINANITNVNGSPDIVDVNNFISKTVGVPLPAVPSFLESWPATSSLPAEWINQNNDNAAGWFYSAAGIGGPGSAKVTFYDSPIGQLDILYSIEAIDLTNALTASLDFSIAHARYSATYSDKFEIVISADCGVTWTSVWMKQGAALATISNFVTSAYNSPSASHWRAESADLTSFIGMTDLLIALKATSGYGNNLHIDNITLNTTVGVNENAIEADISLFPVPSNGMITMNIEKVKASDMHISVTGISGNVVKEMDLVKSANEIQLDFSDLESGSYFIHFTAGDESSVKKILIEK